MSATRLHRRNRTDIDPKFLAFLRTCRCCVCAAKGLEQTTPTEAAHSGPRGLGMRCPDRQSIGLCAEHHRTGRDAQHVLGKRFAAHHGIDIDILFAKYARMYDAGLPEWDEAGMRRLVDDIELLALVEPKLEVLV